MNYEDFVKEVEKDIKKTPEVYQRYIKRGGSKDEEAAYYLKCAFERFQDTKDLKYAVQNASSNIFMEY